MKVLKALDVELHISVRYLLTKCLTSAEGSKKNMVLGCFVGGCDDAVDAGSGAGFGSECFPGLSSLPVLDDMFPMASQGSSLQDIRWKLPGKALHRAPKQRVELCLRCG